MDNRSKGNWNWVSNLSKKCLLKRPINPSTLSDTNFPKFNNIYHTHLINIPNEVEIKKALESINHLKTSGEDDLHVVFYQKNWDIVKQQIIPAIQDTFISETIPNSWGKTLLCLISKIENSHTITHFRPLGLCNTYTLQNSYKKFS